MNRHPRLLEEQFRSAARQQRLCKFLRRSALLGSIVCLLFLLLDTALLVGWINDLRLAQASQILLWIGAAAAWLLIGLIVLGDSPDRRQLADQLEAGNPGLQDRLHTIVHLEKQRNLPSAASFVERISRQTQLLIASRPLQIPLPARGLVGPTATLALLLTLTFWFHDRFQPWTRLHARLQQEAARPPTSTPTSDLPVPAHDFAEVEEPWGEVRITHPGRDLVITPAENVKLQIEAAANRTLGRLTLQSAVNGGEESVRPLPPATEPRYALVQTNLTAEALGLKPWDVLTYHAQAATDDGRQFESELYFLEVHPSQEDLQQLQAGNGQCYNLLSELSGLIQQQQQIIRQTFRHQARPHTDPRLQDQDRHKLAEAQADTGDAVDHLAAQIAGLFPEAPTAPVLLRLDAASLSMAGAGRQLQTNDIPAAQAAERTALSHLSAARQEFQRVLAENPDAFPAPREQTELDPHLRQRLQEMAEFRDELRAARELVREVRQSQERIGTELATPQARTNLQQLAAQERSLERALEDFQIKHPPAFRGSESQAQAARSEMQRTAQAIESRSPGPAEAARAAETAAQQLQQLQSALDQRAAGQRLAEAHQLRQLLEQQSRSLAQCQNPGAAGTASGTDTSSHPASPTRLTADQARQLARDTQSTLRQLGDLLNDQPGDPGFSEELRRLLSPGEQEGLARKLDQVGQAPDPATRSQAAGPAREGVEQITRAFDAGLPRALQAARRENPLNPGTETTLDRAQQQLQDLQERLEQQNGQPAGRDQDLWREILLELSRALSSKSDGNARTAAVAVLVEEELRKTDPLDAVRLGQLLQQLHRTAAEPPPGADAEAEKAAASNIDPQRLPPAYRQRIEEYFRKLSESR